MAILIYVDSPENQVYRQVNGPPGILSLSAGDLISLRTKLLDRFLNVGKLPLINFVQGSFPVVNQIHHSPDKTCKLPCPRRRY